MRLWLVRWSLEVGRQMLWLRRTTGQRLFAYKDDI